MFEEFFVSLQYQTARSSDLAAGRRFTAFPSRLFATLDRLGSADFRKAQIYIIYENKPSDDTENGCV